MHSTISLVAPKEWSIVETKAWFIYRLLKRKEYVTEKIIQDKLYKEKDMSDYLDIQKDLKVKKTKYEKFRPNSIPGLQLSVHKTATTIRWNVDENIKPLATYLGSFERFEFK
ncbi:hypothetical protein PPL_00726 [Heterostelium album PN500]|uniref:Uncharacterized protein n=1 Tax=Heterostelium pallidum (strain ATCC 26659 / Pp 5 / PN500) TaxID=670386 RepID=D3AX95_HETP5|nr:hypothetical protein PPL_00726 [Heterostelium album PN500]EFA86164.1 hypothetical protein PPL_00726 [Heterostelium album PN500]|eukprot:XP_020438269.1 hypothetical protein PPL_00726 [Heterostelium album PN500]